MLNAVQSVERRQFKRFKVKNHIVAINLRQPGIKGPLTDISWGGLAFHYVHNGEQPDEFFELVAGNGTHIYLGKIKVHTVSDIALNNNGVFKPTLKKRCGVRFGKLSNRLTAQLEQFLWNHTV